MLIGAHWQHLKNAYHLNNFFNILYSEVREKQFNRVKLGLTQIKLVKPRFNVA